MTLAIVEPTTLETLAAEINREHQECFLAAVSSLRHAIRAGDALLTAKEQVPRGTWERWVDENCPAVSRMARQYMRLAAYKEMIPSEVTTAIEAQTHLRGLPAFDGSGPHRHPPEVRERALELIGEGVSQRMVSTMLDIDKKCVRRWLDRDGSDAGRREGGYRKGRPTRAEQAKRDEIVNRESRKRAIGPAALAVCFRTVVEANRDGDNVALAVFLRDLANSAAGWADQLERRRAA